MANSAQRSQERDYRRCARNAPKKKYPHFLPIQCRCCPTQGCLGSHISARLVSQEKSHCPTEGHFPQLSRADRSRHMLSIVAAELQGPNSTNSLRTSNSSFRRKKKSPLPCLWLPPSPKGLLLFDFHSAFWPLLPHSHLCNDKTSHPTHFLQFLHKLLSVRPPMAVPKMFSSMRPTLMHAFNVSTSSALHVRSSAPSLKNL